MSVNAGISSKSLVYETILNSLQRVEITAEKVEEARTIWFSQYSEYFCQIGG